MMRGIQKSSGKRVNEDWRYETEQMVVHGFMGLPIKPSCVIGRSKEDDPKRVAYIQQVEARWRARHAQ